MKTREELQALYDHEFAKAEAEGDALLNSAIPDREWEPRFRVYEARAQALNVLKRQIERMPPCPA